MECRSAPVVEPGWKLRPLRNRSAEANRSRPNRQHPPKVPRGHAAADRKAGALKASEASGWQRRRWCEAYSGCYCPRWG
jgi:hypothetical protein